MDFLKKIAANETYKEYKYKLLQTITANQAMVDVGLSISKSITAFAENKSPLSFIEGGISALNSLAKILANHSDDFFTEANGWRKASDAHSQAPLNDILSSVLFNFPHKSVKFAYEIDPVNIHTLPMGEVAKTKRGLFYRYAETSKEEVMECLIKEKIKNIDSKFFSISETVMASNSSGPQQQKYDLVSEDSIAIHSKLSRQNAANIKAFLDKGISRSIIFAGSPGTGKSSMAQSIISLLGLRTLKFHYNYNTDLSVIAFLLKSFKIEAVIIDDFHYINNNALLLGFLEYLHRNVKVVIATVNSMKKFDPAVTRPGRVDQVQIVEHLDPEAIKEILGEELHSKIEKRVAKWPVAFLLEIKYRYSVISDIDLEPHLDELGKRVADQLRLLK